METESRTKKTVLVVEDETLVNWDVADALRDAGFTVLQAYSGDEALEILEDNRDVRVVFTDVNLPGNTDGVALTKLIEDRYPRIEVLVTSAHRRPEVEQLEVVSQLGRFVQKPYPTGAVTRRISEIVEQHAAH